MAILSRKFSGSCRWSCAWARYGIQGKLIDFGKQEEVEYKLLVVELLEFIDDVIDDLGSRKEIEYIHQILEMGTGADRQLAVYEKTNDLNAVVDYIVSETKIGLFWFLALKG